MSTIVCVHGIGQQGESAETLLAKWEPALRGGVSNAGLSLPNEATVACAFYGGLFRPSGKVRSPGDPHYQVADVTEEEALLIRMMWEEAAASEPKRVPSPDADVRAGVSRSIQRALYALMQSRFFAGMTQSALIGNFKQVSAYMGDLGVREDAQGKIDDHITSDTRVLVAHSLGSVVVYEALHRYQNSEKWSNVHALVTLGSPLGIPNLIFDRLEKSSAGERWPQLIREWTNVSDDGDVVALEKRLAPFFGERLIDICISNNTSMAHGIGPYLTAPETGGAIVRGLSCE